jgi:hypothetical protein
LFWVPCRFLLQTLQQCPSQHPFHWSKPRLGSAAIEYEHQRDMLVGQIINAELHSVRNLLPEAKYGSE